MRSFFSWETSTEVKKAGGIACVEVGVGHPDVGVIAGTKGISEGAGVNVPVGLSNVGVIAETKGVREGVDDVNVGRHPTSPALKKVTANRAARVPSGTSCPFSPAQGSLTAITFVKEEDKRP